MLTKIKLALVASLSLLTGAAGIAAAHGGGDGGGTGNHKAELLAKYDANGDGKLDDAEKAKMKADFQAKRAVRKAERLAKFDTNKDGKLEPAERQAMRAERSAERFAKLDTNGDGMLSKDEFAAGAEMHGHGGHGGHFRGAPGKGR